MATQREVKDAFDRLSAELHPDKNPSSPDAAEKFKAVSDAYDTLGDPTFRRFYNAKLGSVEGSRSHYDTLGVSPMATQREVKDAFDRLSAELHPDKNPSSPDAAEKIKAVLAAYAILGNQGKRSSYDAELARLPLLFCFCMLFFFCALMFWVIWSMDSFHRISQQTVDPNTMEQSYHRERMTQAQRQRESERVRE